MCLFVLTYGCRIHDMVRDSHNVTIAFAKGLGILAQSSESMANPSDPYPHSLNLNIGFIFLCSFRYVNRLIYSLNS